MELRGVDVSVFQGNIDWKKVSTSTDVKFAMIRATYGTTGIDTQFTNNIKNIQSTPLYRGVYHHFYSTNNNSAQAEARHFLDVIKPYSFNYPLALDIEEPTIIPLGKATISNLAREFCKVVENAGYYIMIYSSLNWLRNYLDSSIANDYDIWLAQWNSTPTYDGKFGMWQYTDLGTVNGINGNVDMNISYKDYPLIIEENHLNHSTNNGTTTPPSSNSTVYIVKSGDTLWSIAKRFLGNGTLYTLIKDKNGLTSDIIYVGQELIIPSSPDTNNPNNSNPSTPDQSNNIRYTVKVGDTLWGIAEKLLGNGNLYSIIKEANNLTNDNIYVGQVLTIPLPANSSSEMIYTVRAGDTLWGVAEKLLGNGNLYQEIKAANSLLENTIYVGQKLIIPIFKP